ncbi:MAG: hypothetical protein ACKVK5_10760 [Pseudomonadales bacterium]
MDRKNTLILIVLVLGTLSAGMLLALLSTNYFAPVGLVLSISSSAATIAIAFTDAVKARQAEIQGIEPYEPISGKRIRMFDGLVLTSDRIANIEKQLQLVQGKHEELADRLHARFETAMMLARLANERLTQHEEVDLPLMISKHSGAIIASAWLAILGTTIVFAPDAIYSAFSELNGMLSSIVSGALILIF